MIVVRNQIRRSQGVKIEKVANQQKVKMVTLAAKNLNFEDVEHLLGFRESGNMGVFSDYLELEALINPEQTELTEICTNFRRYLLSGRVSEGQIKFLVLAPLMNLAGYYNQEIELLLEENIQRIDILEADVSITGRYDILAVKKSGISNLTKLWVLIVEAKRAGIEPFTGIPQLLTYAYESLISQPSVWGLATNGLHFQFIRICAGELPIYQLFPSLSSIESEPSILILKILKAICKS